MNSLQTGHLLSLWVSSADTHSERRLGTDLTIAQLKLKLEPVTGIPSHSQLLSLQRTNAGSGHSGAGAGPGQKQVIAQFNDDSRTLQSYGVKGYMTIRVDTTDPVGKALAGQYTDVSQVEKFELTEQEYEARPDTVLAYKMRHQLGRFAPGAASNSTASSHSAEEALPQDLKVGARCQVALSEELQRRGSVRYVGPTEFGPCDGRIWVGIEWDEPIGKNDGMVESKRYFQTQPLRASFVRPDKVTLGDFPELDPFADEDEEM